MPGSRSRITQRASRPSMQRHVRYRHETFVAANAIVGRRASGGSCKTGKSTLPDGPQRLSTGRRERQRVACCQSNDPTLCSIPAARGIMWGSNHHRARWRTSTGTQDHQVAEASRRETVTSTTEAEPHPGDRPQHRWRRGLGHRRSLSGDRCGPRGCLLGRPLRPIRTGLRI